MRAVDTNVLVGILARDEPGQAETADRYIERGAWISVVVLIESLWVLENMYNLDATALAESIDRLLNHEHFTVQWSDAVKDALVRFRSHRNVEFTDCLILELARHAGHLPLGTFDRKLARLDGAERIA